MSASVLAEGILPAATPSEPVTSPGESAKMSIAASLTLIGAAALFSVVARRVATKQADPTDTELADLALANQSPVIDTLCKPVTALSMPPVVVAATAGLAWWLYRKERRAAALVVALTPVAAAAVGQSFTMLFPQKNPPDKVDAPAGEAEATFPSGHTTGVTAEALAVAYILSAEKLASWRMVLALLMWPFVVGISRLYRRRHWLSDVQAGWLAGTAVAAASVLGYERMRDRRS